MSGRIESMALERLRRLVGARLGLHLKEVDEAVLAGVLERSAAAGAGGVGAFLDRLAAPGAARELELLAGELTVGETYFFRDADQLRAFGALAAGEPRCERILSAGCASGEEAYSLAILTRDRPATTIVGVDVNAASIARARRARYGEWSLRQTPPELRAGALHEAGREWVVDEAIRKRVSFEVRNLVEDAPEVWRPESFDVIFLRNVIMYFSREVAVALLGRVARALRPGGHLFLGHAESLRELTDLFELRNTHGAFYYQRRERLRAEPIVLPFVAPAPALEAAPPAAAPPSATPPARILPLRPPPAPPPVGLRMLARPLELLREERFSEALDAFAALSPEVRADRQAELVRAVLLLLCGRLADAESVCAARVAAGDEDAGAHYLLALLREQAGELDAAVAEDRIAARIDPGFAMPHLHMGLLALRAGDRRLGARALATALPLLAREDATRMLLFGGGFAREALVELCRAELRTAGERA